MCSGTRSREHLHAVGPCPPQMWFSMASTLFCPSWRRTCWRWEPLCLTAWLFQSRLGLTLALLSSSHLCVTSITSSSPSSVRSSLKRSHSCQKTSSKALCFPWSWEWPRILHYPSLRFWWIKLINPWSCSSALCCGRNSTIFLGNGRFP